MKRMNVSLERIHTFGMSLQHKERGDTCQILLASRNLTAPNEGNKRITKTESLRNFAEKKNEPTSEPKEDVTSSDEEQEKPSLEVKVEVVHQRSELSPRAPADIRPNVQEAVVSPDLPDGSEGRIESAAQA